MTSGKNILISIKDFFSKFSKNLTWIFFSFFLLLVVLEVWVIKSSVDVALSLNEVRMPAKTEKGVRIDFEGYKAAIKRIEGSKNFVHTSTLKIDPFTTPTPTPIGSSTPLSLP